MHFDDNDNFWLLLILLGFVVLFAVCWGCVQSGRKQSRMNESGNLLRESLLGGASDRLPGAQLAQQNVVGRWTVAQQASANVERFQDSVGEASFSSVGMSRVAKSGRIAVFEMFSDDHVPQLRPRSGGWRAQVIGKGNFGTVYKATWRGTEVAVKEIRLPEESTNSRSVSQ